MSGQRDKDGDGVGDIVEARIGDGNNDYISDEWQAYVTSFVSKTNSKSLTLVSPKTTFLVEVYSLNSKDVGVAPEGVTFQYGMIHFVVKCPSHQTEVTLNLYLPKGSTGGGFMNYGPTADNPQPHFYSFVLEDDLGAVLGLNPITLYVRDGGWGDNDLTANGRIELLCGPTLIRALQGPVETDKQDPTTVKDWPLYQ